MKTITQLRKPSRFINLFVLFIIGCFYGNAQVLDKDQINPNKPETELLPERLWDVKAYHPEVKFIKIKAIDKDGKMYDVKAFQRFHDTSILNVKAIVNGEQLPVKLIVKENDIYYPLKAIANDGTLLDIKAVTDSGALLPLKGLGKEGNIVYIRAIAKDASFYNVFAISPEGRVNDVKGVKMLSTTVETTINVVFIFAHVKAMRQN
jgi:hypothetical protein